MSRNLPSATTNVRVCKVAGEIACRFRFHEALNFFGARWIRTSVPHAPESLAQQQVPFHVHASIPSPDVLILHLRD
jgi:hypothetical protein